MMMLCLNFHRSLVSSLGSLQRRSSGVRVVVRKPLLSFEKSLSASVLLVPKSSPCKRTARQLERSGAQGVENEPVALCFAVQCVPSAFASCSFASATRALTR